jgi:hypothetical protein
MGTDGGVFSSRVAILTEVISEDCLTPSAFERDGDNDEGVIFAKEALRGRLPEFVKLPYISARGHWR